MHEGVTYQVCHQGQYHSAGKAEGEGVIVIVNEESSGEQDKYNKEGGQAPNILKGEDDLS